MPISDELIQAYREITADITSDSTETEREICLEELNELADKQEEQK